MSCLSDADRAHIESLIGDEITLDVSGFYYWEPITPKGYMTSSFLRLVADYLDEKNKPWQERFIAEMDRINEKGPIDVGDFD